MLMLGEGVDLLADLPIAILDQYMAVAMWNCHSGPLDVSTGGSIGQCRFICQVLCTGIQGFSVLLPGGSISQSRFICQVLCTGIQGIFALLPGGSIRQSRFICQVLCTGIQCISALVLGGPSAKEGSSAKFELTCCFMPCFTEGLFCITYKRPNYHCLTLIH